MNRLDWVTWFDLIQLRCAICVDRARTPWRSKSKIKAYKGDNDKHESNTVCSNLAHTKVKRQEKGGFMVSPIYFSTLHVAEAAHSRNKMLSQHREGAALLVFCFNGGNPLHIWAKLEEKWGIVHRININIVYNPEKNKVYIHNNLLSSVSSAVFKWET